MVANFNGTQELVNRLLAGLAKIPSDWPLTPLKGDKRPYRLGWQTEKPVQRSVIEGDIKAGRAQGYGLRTGEISGGILALDLDGSSAIAKLLELSDGRKLPETVAFTSGRPGRCQYLYLVTPEYWTAIQTRKLATGVEGELIELRWDGCQSALPPSVHPQTGEYVWVTGCSPEETKIAVAPTWLVELMLREPENTQQTSPQPETPSGKWSDVDWARSYLEALSPSRADDYTQWLEVGMALHTVSDELLADWDFWSQSSAKYKPGCCESKWKTFKSSGVSIGTLAHLSKLDGWINPLHKESPPRSSNSQTVGNTSDGGSKPPIEEINLLARVAEILSRNLLPSQLKAAYIDLSQSTGRPLREIEELSRTIETEGEFDSEAAEATLNLPKLLQTHNQSLDPANFLWGDGGMLARAMNATAAAMPCAAAMIFATFIAASAPRIGVSSRVIVKASAKYVQHCIFWVAVVARSGELKTPAQRAAIDPLVKLEIESKKKYDADVKRYEKEQELWQKGDPPPVKPQPRVRRLTKDATLESLERIYAENPRGLTYYCDELLGMEKSRNAFKPQGKGADLESELDQWNGSPLIVDRKDRTICIDRTAISRTGSSQWEPFQTFAGNTQESFNGLLARWLIVAVKSPLRYLTFDDQPDTGLSALLEKLYLNLETLPDQDYLIDKDSQALFKVWQNHLVDCEVQENHPGLKLVYPKIEAYTARFALWLHCVNATLAGTTPAPSIPGTTMSRAIELAAFFLGQARLVYAVNSSQSNLTGRLMKLHQFAEGKSAGITPSLLKANSRSFRSLSVSEILRDCQTLVTSGYLHQEGKRFYFIDKNVDKIDSVSTFLSTPETITNNTSQPFIDKIDKIDNLSKKSQTQATQIAETVLGTKPSPGDGATPEAGFKPSSESIDGVVNFVNLSMNNGETLTESVIDTVDKNIDTASIIDKNIDTNQGWLSDENLTEACGYLTECDAESLPYLRTLLPDEVFVAALNRLSEDSRAKIENWMTQVVEPKLAIGDRVKVIYPTHPLYGQIGEVSPNNTAEGLIDGSPLYVSFGDRQSLIQLEYLERVDSDGGDDPPGGGLVPVPSAPDSGDPSSPEQILSDEQPTPVSEVEVIDTSLLPADRAREACSVVNGGVVVDEARLDIFSSTAEEIPEWGPRVLCKTYEETSRLYVDIETLGLNPETDRIIAVGLKLDGKYTIISHVDEKILLQQTIEFLKSSKVEILIGHNLFSFDLPFIIERCKKYNIRAPFYIDDYERVVSNTSVHGSPIRFKAVRWKGVNIIDSYQQLAIWDFSSHKLSSLSLKKATLELGLRAEARLELHHTEIGDLWEAGDDVSLSRIFEYLKYDLDDTELLANRLVPSIYYLQEAISGMSLQELGYRGNGAKWNHILTTHYGNKPEPDEKLSFNGGFADATAGLFRGIAKIDVASLYPTIMLKYGITTSKDEDNYLLGVLYSMRELRLHYKKLAKAGDVAAGHRQEALKILINSGFGFLGTQGISFNDYVSAALVTAYGRRILGLMLDVIKSHGGASTQVDTDGVCFQHPNPEIVYEAVQASLPEGIKLELEWQADAIYIPLGGDGVAKRKNYLVFKDGDLKTAKGGANSRVRSYIERNFAIDFLKRYLDQPQIAIDYALTLIKDIESGVYPVENLQITRKVRDNEKSLQPLLSPGSKMLTFYVGSSGEPVTEGTYNGIHYAAQIKTMFVEVLKTIRNSGENIPTVHVGELTHAKIIGLKGDYTWEVTEGSFIDGYKLSRIGANKNIITQNRQWAELQFV